jgi:hypothetical protein
MAGTAGVITGGQDACSARRFPFSSTSSRRPPFSGMARRPDRLTPAAPVTGTDSSMCQKRVGTTEFQIKSGIAVISRAKRQLFFK